MDTQLPYLKKRQQSIRMFYVVLLLMMLMAFLSLWISGYLTLVLVLAELALHFFFLRPSVKRYAKECNHANIEATVVQALTGGALRQGKGFTAGEIAGARLLPVEQDAGAVWSDWMVTGRRDGVQVAMADVSLRYGYTAGGRQIRRFATGCWLSLQLPTDTGCKLWAVHRNAYTREARLQYYGMDAAMEQFLCGDEEADGAFAFYRETGSACAPDKRYLHRLMNFQKYTPGGPLAVALIQDRMYIYIANRFMARRITLSQAPNREQLQFNPLPELGEAISLAKTACNCCSVSSTSGGDPLRQAAIV